MKTIMVAGLLMVISLGVNAQDGPLRNLVQLASTGPLSLTDVTVNSNQVGLFEKLEVTFHLQGEWDNPYDPDQIQVDAQFRAPDGEQITIPGFFYQPYHQNASGRLEAVGSPEWKIRFAPDKLGEYDFQVIARNRGRMVESDVHQFRSVSYSASPGFLRISETNPLYFEFDDGTPFFAVAMDMSQGDNRGTYQRFANAGGNFNRLFLTNGRFNLEELNPTPRPDRGLGKMNQEAAWNLDHMLDLGEKLGIYHMLTLTNQWTFNSRWFEHTYNKENGGVLDRAADYFTSEEAMQYFERRLRYLVARWGHSTSLFSWDLWNEYSAAPGSAGENGVNWHRRMAKYIASLDAYGHPIHTNDGSLNGRDDVHSMPEMEIISTNTYTVKDIAHVAETWTRYHTSRFNKPYLLTEFGMGHASGAVGGYAGQDPERRMVHDGLWSPLVSGSAGTGMAWEGNWLNHPLFYTYTRAISRIVSGVPFSKREWAPVSVSSFRFLNPATPSYHGDVLVEGWPGNFRMISPTDDRVFRVNKSGRVEGQEALNAVLTGRTTQGNPSRRTSTVTFDVDFPVDGTFVVYVTELRDTTVIPRLTVTVDGKQVIQQELGRLAVEGYHPLMYNQYYTADLPKGTHTIRVENSGGGSFVTAYELSNFVEKVGPDLEVRGIQTEDHILLWLKNQKYTVLHHLAGLDMETQPAGLLELRDVADGTWVAEWVNTIDAADVKTEIVRSSDKKLILETPAVKESVAVRLRKVYVSGL